MAQWIPERMRVYRYLFAKSPKFPERQVIRGGWRVAIAVGDPAPLHPSAPALVRG